MKEFKLKGLDFECNDKFNYAAGDPDGSVWVFVEDPNCTPYGWDVEKCPHNLSEKSLEELSEYALKAYYYGDEDVEVDYRKQVDPKLLKAVEQYKRPGNWRK